MCKNDGNVAFSPSSCPEPPHRSQVWDQYNIKKKKKEEDKDEEEEGETK